MPRATAGAGGLSRLGADWLLLATSAIWGVTFVVQKDIGALPPLAFVAARFAVSALAVAPLALLERRGAGAAARAARLAPGARHRPHAVSRREPATGGPRDHQRHQWRLSHRLLCRLDAVRRVGAVAAASARDRACGRRRLAGRGLAARDWRRADPSADDRRRAGGARRSRLGDRHRAHADLSRQDRAAADACLFAICGLRGSRRRRLRRS